MAATLEGVFLLIDRASDTLQRIERQAEKTDRALGGAGDTMDRIGTPRQVRNMERTERQMKNVDRGAVGMGRSMDRAEKSGGMLESRLVRVGAKLAAMGRIITILKFPAMVAGLGLAAQGVGALAGGVVGLVPELTNLSGVVAALPAGLIAVGGAALTVKLAMGEVGKALGGNQQAMKRLTPQAREFVSTLKSYQPVVTELRNSAQAGLFPGLTRALGTAQRARPLANRLLGRFGRTLGGGADRAVRSFTSRNALGDFDTLGRQGDRILGRLIRGAINLGQALRHIAVAARPFTEWLSNTALGWTKSLRAAAKHGRETGSLSKFFERARHSVQRMFNILGNIWNTLRGITRAARPLSEHLWGGFEKVTQTWEDFTNSGRGQRRMRQWFRAIRPPLDEFFGLVGDIALAWVKITEAGGGESGPLTRTLKELRRTMVPLTEMLTTASAALGPLLAENLYEFVRLLNNLPFTPIAVMLDVLSEVLGVVNDLIEQFPLLGTIIAGLLTAAALQKFTGFFTLLKKGWTEARGAATRYQQASAPTRGRAPTFMDPTPGRGPQAPIGAPGGTYIDPIHGPQAASGRTAGRNYMQGFKAAIRRDRAGVRDALGRTTDSAGRTAGRTSGNTYIDTFGNRVERSSKRGGKLGNSFHTSGRVAGGIFSAATIATFVPDLATGLGDALFGPKSQEAGAVREESDALRKRGIFGYLKDSVAGHPLGGGKKPGALRGTGDTQSIWSQIGGPMRSRRLPGRGGFQMVPDIGAALGGAQRLKPLKDLQEQQKKSAEQTRTMRRSMIADLTDVNDKGGGKVKKLRQTFKIETDSMNRITDQGFGRIVTTMNRHLARIGGGGGTGPGGTHGGHPSTAAAATGLRIRGRGLGDTVPVAPGHMAAPGELIVNRHTERRIDGLLGLAGTSLGREVAGERRPHSAAYGTRTVAAPAAGGSVGQSGLQAGISRVAAAVLQHFPGLSITSTTGGGHAAGSYHYKGQAVDIGGAYPLMNQAAGWIRGRLGRNLTEGIHNPNLSVKNGQAVPPSFWGASTWAQHANHIHLAVAGLVGALGGLAGGGQAPRIRMPGAYAGGRGLRGQASASSLRRVRRAAQRRLNQAYGGSLTGFHGGGSNTANMRLGHRMMLAMGFGEGDWGALRSLWQGESGWSHTVANQSSGAYGIPQALPGSKMASAGADWRTNPATQIAWGLQYIKQRYGSPSGALAAWQARSPHWYGGGGRIPWFGGGADFVANRPQVIGVGDGGRERVTVSSGRGGGGGSRPLIGQLVVHNHRDGDVRAQVTREIRQALRELRTELSEAGVEDGDLT